MNDSKVFSVDMTVRFRDLDAMGHVNNAVFFTYFEQARIQFFEEVFHILEPSEFNIILASIRCNFLKPLTLKDKIALRLQVGRIGTKSFTLNYQVIHRSDSTAIYATGESVQVWFDYTSNRTVEISEEQRQKLNPYLSS